MTPLLSVEKLNVFYDAFQAVHDVDLTVGEGEIVSIIGANGAGKSSFLKALVRQAGRVTGSARLDGCDLAALSTREIVAKGIALVPEGRKLFPTLTIFENLRIGQELGRKGDIGFEQVYEWFPVLRERRDSRARELSGGQQQMVALGRALLANPRLLLCDEISLGLAPRVVNELYAIIPQVRERGVAVVVVEQDISRSLAVADRFVCFLEGEVSLSGRPADADRDTIMQHYFGGAH
ncbi:branched-chain amino acid transport system ATP-binding protein [Roseiarcus fermentans]|uniref:Branched-chain amino acid transport system ATP-binding protein n=1 Tax=Roseiarcus fermentans TaxID=1473586 RepID=A0A366FSW7_9HYPH|nr:ABC transporter ATP-binding protein [Roseiarcus fermentans]RBP17773.1 branched-chain amino acid transport system ATP-binding protein [Roseiarcus fermentans]